MMGFASLYPSYECGVAPVTKFASRMMLEGKSHRHALAGVVGTNRQAGCLCRRLHADHKLLPKLAKSFRQRRQFRVVAGIENAAHFLLVFPDSSPQLGLADAGALECLQYRDLGSDLRLDRNRDQAPSFRLRNGYGKAAPRVSQQRQAHCLLGLLYSIGFVVTLRDRLRNIGEADDHASLVTRLEPRGINERSHASLLSIITRERP